MIYSSHNFNYLRYRLDIMRNMPITKITMSYSAVLVFEIMKEDGAKKLYFTARFVFISYFPDFLYIFMKYYMKLFLGQEGDVWKGIGGKKPFPCKDPGQSLRSQQ